MGTDNHYEILGVAPDASDDEVKQAFRELAKHYHPDHNPGDDEAERQFKRVNFAYDSLRDAGRRQVYNEWLAFDERQKNVKRVQWSRLLAVLIVLLVGPSMILYWLASQRSIAVTESATDERNTTAPPKTEASGGASQPDEKAQFAGQAKPVAPTDAPNAVMAKNEARPDTPITGKDEASPSAEHQPREPTQPSLNEEQPRPPSNYTQALQNRTRPQAAAPNAGAPSSSVDSGGAGADPSVAPESSARATARMLADLTEPGGTLPPEQQSEPARQRGIRNASRQTGLSPETDSFTDCTNCPLMSLARRSSSARGETDLAISLAEVTVSQWNACVQAGICQPYRSPDGNPSAPVVGLSERAASQYALYLSGMTGHPYRIVMPLVTEAQRRSALADECGGYGQRRNGGGWDWLEDKPNRDCLPGVRRDSREKQQGFRVARRLGNDG